MERVVRGGAYYFFPARVSCQWRINWKPHNTERIGARLARALDSRTAPVRLSAAPGGTSR